MTEKKIDFAVGGQALIEGVMMRSPNHVTTAVRKSNGSIRMKDEVYRSICTRVQILGTPIIRGVVNLFEMMILGTRMLNYSAAELVDEEGDQQENKPTGRKDKIIMGLSFAMSIVFALGLSLFLFKFLPLTITELLSRNFKYIANNYLIYNLIDGTIKMTFFIAYIAILGLMPSLGRVFMYHGAEHKSIFTYEKGLPLTVKNARSQSRFHPRCGTSFILVVFFISIFIYTFVPKLPDFFANFGLRILFLPVIAGVSYEFLKWSAKHQHSFFMRQLIRPGLLFQRLTTREPDDAQLETALAALSRALELEAALESAVPSPSRSSSHAASA